MFTFTRSATPFEAHQALRHATPARMIDVRSRSEFAKGHALGAESMPLDELTPQQLAAADGALAPLFVICETGVRAEQAVHKLRRLGLEDTVIVDGGTRAWRRHGLPVRQARGAFSIERQVQAVIGTLLVAILAKSMLLHPAFYVLAGLLAATLIVGGRAAQDRVAQWLSRLPWNRGPAAAA